jgi:hypothetical protein
MAYMASGTLGAVAAILALGAVHIDVAAGNDRFAPAQRGDARVTMPVRGSDEMVVTNVDRSAKGDRDTSVPPAGGLTLSFRLPSLPDTSIMMRVPAGESADAVRKAPVTMGTGKGSSDRSSAGQRPIACEPVVSVLTAVARQLAPGRCVT